MKSKNNITHLYEENIIEIEKSLNEHFDMHIGINNSTNKYLFKQLNIKNFVARSVRTIYNIDNFIIKATSDATMKGLPLGSDQCLNEFKIFTSSDERLQEFRKILCPVYAIYESKFIYFTINKLLTPLAKNNNSNETIYDYVKKGNQFNNQSNFFTLLEKFKKEWITNTPIMQNEYSKLSTFGYDENNNLYILDYGML